MNTDFKNIIDLFEAQAAAFPDHLAIAGGEEKCTYADLKTATDELAKNLTYFGSTREELCFVFVKSAMATAKSMISILKAGKIFVPINPEFPNALIQKLILDYQPSWIILAPENLQRLERISEDLKAQSFSACYYDLSPLEDNTALAKFDFISTSKKLPVDTVAQPTLKADDPCYIYFTSGSTGTPKAILGAFKGINHFIDWEINYLDLPKQVKVSQFAAPSFDAFLRDLFVPLCTGGTCCIPPQKEGVLSLDEVIDWIDREGIQLIHCVPTVLRELISLNQRPQLQPKALQYVLLSGESLYGEDVQNWKASFGDQAQLINLYGASETTMIKFAYAIDYLRDTAHSIPIGQPISGCKAIILDDNMMPCKQGNVGEIYVRTAYRALGYYQNPALTAKVFVKHPKIKDPNDLLYKTGDLGMIRKDGNFEFRGRKDFQVKIRGVRVELGSIEALLLQHEIVEDAVVFYDQETKVLAACLRIGEDVEVEASDVKAYLLQYTPHYMVPAHYIFLDAFPKNANGKTNRKALEQELKQLIKMKSVPFLAPRNKTERSLATIWKELLNVERVSVYDNFFELGGYSLLATRVVSAIKRDLEVDISLRELFENPTIEQLAEFVEQKEKDNFVFGNGFKENALMLPLNKLKNEQRTIFMLPPILGSSIIYYPLANKFEDVGVNCIGFQFKGFDRDDDFHNSIEEMAKAYYDEMMDLIVDKTAPIILFGFSMGALIAFEIVRLLEKDGRSCEKLILVDKNLPTNKTWNYQKMRKALDRKVVKALNSSGDEVEGIMTMHLNDYEVDFPPSELERITTLLEHSQTVLEAYKPGKHKIKADILALEANKVKKRTEKKMKDWKQMTNGELEHHYIMSNHFRILEFHLLPKIVDLSMKFIEEKTFSNY
ncbi:MAG: amino acid adenylation domain-containing protein [Saprospiraceae bacterium]